MSRSTPMGAESAGAIGARVRCIYGVPGPLEQRLSTLDGCAGLDLLLFRLDFAGSKNAFADGVLDGCTALLEAIQDLLERAADPPNIAIVLPLSVPDETWTTAAAAATVEAVRGVMYSLTPELGRAARINLVTCAGDGGDDEALAATLRFLDSPGGGYIAGSTFDLLDRS